MKRHQHFADNLSREYKLQIVRRYWQRHLASFVRKRTEKYSDNKRLLIACIACVCLTAGTTAVAIRCYSPLPAVRTTVRLTVSKGRGVQLEKALRDSLAQAGLVPLSAEAKWRWGIWKMDTANRRRFDSFLIHQPELSDSLSAQETLLPASKHTNHIKKE